MKRILIFGAGTNQLELIRAAKELGVVSIVIDPMSDAPGIKEADFFYKVDGNDYKTTKEIAIKHQIDGIVTAQMENPLRLMSHLAQEMKYIFHSPQIIEKCRNKYLMKQAFIKQNVACAHGILLSKDDLITVELLKDNNLFFPLIIKPLDAYSSRGVYKAENFDDLMAHTLESVDFSSTGEFLIEEFITGMEYSVEAITFQGETNIIQITEKIITPYPRTVEIGHLQPDSLNVKGRNELEEMTKKAIRALEIDNSASHTELKITPDGIKVIEVGARLGGDFIGSYLTKASTGVNMDKAAIQVALGIKPDIHINHDHYSYIKYAELPVGKKVLTIDNYDDIFNLPDLIFAHIFIKAGDITQPITHSALRPACVIVKSKNRKDVLLLADEYINILINKIQLYDTR